jgi:hypothetical protein
LACGALTLTTTPARASGGCVDVGCVVQPFTSAILLVPIAAAFLVGLGADVYYTGADLSDAFAGDPTPKSTARHELYWTGWQSGILGIYSATVMGLDGDLATGAMPMLAFTTWPLGLTTHGTFWVTEDKLARYTVGGGFAAADATLLGYDLVGLVRGRRVGTGYAILEVGTGTLQTLYGVAWATNQEGSKRNETLALTAAPALLTIHGVTSLIVGTGEKENAPEPNDLRKLRMTPALLPREGGVELVVRGIF